MAAEPAAAASSGGAAFQTSLWRRALSSKHSTPLGFSLLYVAQALPHSALTLLAGRLPLACACLRTARRIRCVMHSRNLCVCVCLTAKNYTGADAGGDCNL